VVNPLAKFSLSLQSPLRLKDSTHIDVIMPKEASAKRTSKATSKRSKEAPAKGRRRAKVKKDPSAPKRGLSAYMFFANETRDQVKKDSPTASFGTISYATRLPRLT
jgi:hypothetical protein